MNKKRSILTKAVCSLCVASLVIPTVYNKTSEVDAVAAENELIQIETKLSAYGTSGTITWSEFKQMFPDEVLYEQMKEIVLRNTSISEGVPFNYSELTDIENLYLEGEEGKTLDLTGIERLTGVESVWIEGDVESLAPIAALPGVKEFCLQHVDNIESLEELSGLTTLTEVDLLACDNLNSLKGLENNKEIEYLRVYQCGKFGDISVCKEFSKLKTADLYGSHYLDDISALANLQYLERVDVYNSKVTDISALKNKTTLQRLNIGNTEVFADENKETSCEVLSTLTNLEVFEARSGEIDDDVMQIVCKLTKITMMDLLYNDITNLSGIENLSNIEVLDIAGNKIFDFCPLSKLPLLKGYSVSNVAQKREYFRLKGNSYVIQNPFIGMDGNPVVPNASENYTYNPADNTIILDEANKPENSIYSITYDMQMDYHGNDFIMELALDYEIGLDEITITKQPENVNCTEGDKITLSVEAQSDDDAFSYQWYKDDVALDGKTASSIEVAAAALADTGDYKCVIRNASTSVTSDVATVTVQKKEEPTTEEPTTEEPTTEEPTTEEPTTEEPTTEEPTSEEPTTEEPTTKEPTTEKATTEEPTTKKQETANPQESATTKQASEQISTPVTGDDMSSAVWMVILFGSVAVFAGIIVAGKKKIKD